MYASEFINNEIVNLKKQQSSWVNSLGSISDEEELNRKNGIILDITLKLCSLEQSAALLKGCRGLGVDIHKQVVDKYYRENLKLDENNEWVEEK